MPEITGRDQRHIRSVPERHAAKTCPCCDRTVTHAGFIDGGLVLVGCSWLVHLWRRDGPDALQRVPVPPQQVLDLHTVPPTHLSRGPKR